MTVRMTEPMPCPRCRRLVVPGETEWYDLDEATWECGEPHACPGPAEAS
jgi:hypothetical protein